jgi:hypothetical protein
MNTRSARRLALRATLAVALAVPALGAQAQEVTLKAVNAFQEGTYYARNFEKFVQKVNAEGKGVVQINYLGGPKAIPTMEQGAALRNARGRPVQYHHLLRGRRVARKPGRQLRHPVLGRHAQGRHGRLPEQADDGKGPVLLRPHR